MHEFACVYLTCRFHDFWNMGTRAPMGGSRAAEEVTVIMPLVCALSLAATVMGDVPFKYKPVQCQGVSRKS